MPEQNSLQLSVDLDFMWRPRWATYYRRGCSAPTFSRIDRINNTLIIDCLPSMQPKYGFKTRHSINKDYTGPVSIDEHEWIYAKCNLPFFTEPTIRLHLHSQPLPSVSEVMRERPNVVFIQFDALGRQAMRRRMPRSYELLTSYSTTDPSSSLLTRLNRVGAVEFHHLNVNGKNSVPNMHQLYCGSGNCKKTSLLSIYKQSGYSTSLIDTYGFQPKGFVPQKSVDRILAANYFIEYGRDAQELYSHKSGCVANTTWITDEIFDYLRDRFIMMRSGGWFSINNVLDAHSEDELNNYAVMDIKFHEFLLDLNRLEALDNTIMIIVADHGLHGHDWKELWREFDQRNPLLHVLVGKNILGFDDIIESLKANSDKLVTHGDIYMTIASFSETALPLKLANTVNLFTEQISINRTCQTADIPDEWCNCWVPKPCIDAE
ncbi:unnamed protein product [Adineta steineri]|uniref:Uncharacterized protein n=1 Tax=Adineta steineri TaxID=433720 RepID=A0A818SKU6_9BILA|nr:unnamed protein product [Adineta steineri]CAF3671433.1 unnamed protein product [Adineta steineri]